MAVPNVWLVDDFELIVVGGGLASARAIGGRTAASDPGALADPCLSFEHAFAPTTQQGSTGARPLTP